LIAFGYYSKVGVFFQLKRSQTIAISLGTGNFLLLVIVQIHRSAWNSCSSHNITNSYHHRFVGASFSNDTQIGGQNIGSDSGVVKVIVSTRILSLAPFVVLFVIVIVTAVAVIDVVLCYRFILFFVVVIFVVFSTYRSTFVHRVLFFKGKLNAINGARFGFDNLRQIQSVSIPLGVIDKVILLEFDFGFGYRLPNSTQVFGTVEIVVLQKL